MSRSPAILKTRITTLLGIKHPIILPGMSWISVPKLVAAVSNAGGLGILATGTNFVLVICFSLFIFLCFVFRFQFSPVAH